MLTNTEIIIRLGLGALIGGLIGFERQIHGRPAGFRTNMLVCVASVLIMIVSEYYHYLSTLDPSYVRVDPARIAAGAITGIGFLGGGVIVKMGATVSGLTTAACIWMVSVIGISIGAGLYLAAIVSFLITVFALVLLRPLENMMPRLHYRTLILTAGLDFDESEVEAAFRKHGVSIFSTDYDRDTAIGETLLRYIVIFSDGRAPKELLDDISSLDGVRKVGVRS